MNCFETQNLIMQYVNDELSGIKLEQFLDHIEKCDSCKEELEIYYILLTGIKQLDEDKVIMSNYHAEFKKKLEHSRILLLRSNKNFVRRLIVMVMIAIMPTIFIQADFASVKDRGQLIATLTKESDFGFEIFEDIEKDKLDELIEIEYDNIKKYCQEAENEETDELNNED